MDMNDSLYDQTDYHYQMQMPAQQQYNAQSHQQSHMSNAKYGGGASASMETNRQIDNFNSNDTAVLQRKLLELQAELDDLDKEQSHLLFENQ